jgi:hypothetical protein
VKPFTSFEGRRKPASLLWAAVTKSDRLFAGPAALRACACREIIPSGWTICGQFAEIPHRDPPPPPSKHPRRRPPQRYVHVGSQWAR